MSALRRLVGCRDDRPLFVAASVVVLALLGVYPLVDVLLRHLWASGVPGFEWVAPFQFHFNDFGVYATAIARWKTDQLIYWRNSGGGFFATYLYPPVYLLVFRPFYELGTVPAFQALPLADTPAKTSGLLFEMASVLALWLGLQAMARVSGLGLAWYERLLGLWLLVGFQPLLYSTKLGQVSAMVAAGFAFAYVAMTADLGGRLGRAAAVASGVLTAGAAGVKLYYATSGAHLLRNRWRLAGGLGGGLTLLALSVWVFGVQNHLEYLTVLTWGKGWGTSPRAVYLWHPGYFEPLFAIGRQVSVATIAIRLGLIGAVALLAWLARTADVRRATFALGIAVYPLGAPEVYTQDFVALLVVAAILLAVEFDVPDGRPWLPVAAVGLLGVHAHTMWVLSTLLPTTVPFGEWARTVAPVLQPGLWGCLLLFGLAAYRVAEPIALRAAIGSIRRTIADGIADCS